MSGSNGKKGKKGKGRRRQVFVFPTNINVRAWVEVDPDADNALGEEACFWGIEVQSRDRYDSRELTKEYLNVALRAIFPSADVEIQMPPSLDSVGLEEE